MNKASFHLGVVHYVSFPETITGNGPIASTVEKIIRLNQVSAVEITWIKDAEQRALTKNLLQSWGGSVVFSGAPILAISQKSLCAADEGLRRDSVEVCKKIIDDALEFSATSVLFISGSDPGLERRQEAKILLIRSLIEIARYAHKADERLRVTLEPADRDIHRRQFIGPIAESVEIVKEVRKEVANFGLTIDMSHLAQLGEDKRSALAAAEGYFHHVHIANAIVRNKNNPRYGDEHPRFGIEEGEHDQERIVHFLKDLDRVGFFNQRSLSDRPIISLEVKPSNEEDPEVLLTDSVDTFLKAFSTASSR